MRCGLLEQQHHREGEGEAGQDHTGAWLSPGPSSGWDAGDRRVLVKLTWTLDQIVEPAAVIHRDFIYPVYDVYLCNWVFISFNPHVLLEH